LLHRNNEPFSMKICIFGAGAIGGHVAARYARGGAEVSVIARGAYLEGIRARGLTIEAPDATFTERVRATADPRELGPQDAVIVTVKAPALASVAAAIAPLLGPETPVAFVMNGIPWFYFDHHGGPLDGTRLARLDPDEAVRRTVTPARAIGGVVYSACTVLEPGRIHVEHNRNRIVYGEPDNKISARCEAIAAPLRAGGFRVDVTDRIRDGIWEKLVLNLASGPLSVLAQSAPVGYAAEPGVADAIRRIVAEGEAIARALGCQPHIDVETQIQRATEMTHEPSILQDLKLGRPMEVDGIFGATLDLARLAGVATPLLDLMVALLKTRAKVAGLYP
jgi:2-dehydropantoate 2-reductase